MKNSKYHYYNSLFKNQSLPLAYCDLDLLDKNIKDIANRTANAHKTIRIASKSVRSTSILKRILDSHSIYKGLMCFSGSEAIFLSESGFDDLLLGYPIVNADEITKICEATKNAKTIVLMVDCIQHLEQINAIAKAIGTIQAVCIDIDMSTSLPGLHFGVMRSPITSIQKAKKLVDAFEKFLNIKLSGVMGYEAQVAGLGENNPANGIKNYVIPFLKKYSNSDYTYRRREVIAYIKSKNITLDFVNAGGTGSIESSKKEDWVTEITVGSGFYSPALFDYYENFKHEPAVGFAVQIVRKPSQNIYTCLGGGYIASGSIGIDKQPKPYLPEGIKLSENEGTGEVQTPVEYNGKEQLSIGDTILFRHSKAGELCERFNQLQLVSAGKIVGTALTYRGEGKCFL